MFGEPAMIIAAIDRLVHHAVVVEMNVQSYRQKSATQRKGRPAIAGRKAEPQQEPHPADTA